MLTNTESRQHKERVKNGAGGRLQNGQAHYLLGEVLEAQGNFSSAIKEYSRAAELDEYFAVVARGRVYERLQEFDRAAADYCAELSDRIREGVPPDRAVSSVARDRAYRPGPQGSRHPTPELELAKLLQQAAARSPTDQDLRACLELVLSNIPPANESTHDADGSGDGR